VSAHVDPPQMTSASGPARRAMLAHLKECAACRSRAAAHDPTILFGLLAFKPLPEPLLNDLSVEVARRAGRDRSALGMLAEAVAWPRRVAVAAVAVLALLSGYATLRERVAAPPELALSQPRADVEVTAGEGVSQVIDLTVGETQIVMVYNGDLKL